MVSYVEYALEDGSSVLIEIGYADNIGLVKSLNKMDESI